MATSPAGSKPAPRKNTTKTADPTKAAGKAAPDWERIIQDIAKVRAEIMASRDDLHGVEQDLVRVFIEMHQVGIFEERLPMQSDADTIAQEFAFRHGRADIIMFHADGTATVIEAKDGRHGHTHVVSGIGQCGLYAAQLSARPGALRAVRRALMWTSVGTIEGDALIEEVCGAAGVIPLPYPSTITLVANRMAAEVVISRLQGATEDGCS